MTARHKGGRKWEGGVRASPASITNLIFETREKKHTHQQISRAQRVFLTLYDTAMIRSDRINPSHHDMTWYRWTTRAVKRSVHRNCQSRGGFKRLHHTRLLLLPYFDRPAAPARHLFSNFVFFLPAILPKWVVKKTDFRRKYPAKHTPFILVSSSKICSPPNKDQWQNQASCFSPTGQGSYPALPPFLLF